MNKYSGVLILVLILVSCNNKNSNDSGITSKKTKDTDVTSMHNGDKDTLKTSNPAVMWAKEKADKLLDDIGLGNALQTFMEDSLLNDKLEDMLTKLYKNCDFNNRDGNFNKHFVFKSNNKLYVGLVYEFYLKCDDSRIYITYNIDKNPKLVGFKIEKLSVISHVKLDSLRKLKVRK